MPSMFIRIHFRFARLNRKPEKLSERSKSTRAAHQNRLASLGLTTIRIRRHKFPSQNPLRVKKLIFLLTISKAYSTHET